MNKGILRFVAEAYLLLHSVSAVQSEEKPEEVPADRGAADKRTPEHRSPAANRPEKSRERTPDKI